MMILLILWLILSWSAAAPLNFNVDKEPLEEDLVTDNIVNGDGMESDELHNHREARHVFYGGNIKFTGTIHSHGTRARVNIGSISTNALSQEPHNEPESQETTRTPRTTTTTTTTPETTRTSPTTRTETTATSPTTTTTTTTPVCMKEDNYDYWGNDIEDKQTAGQEGCANWCGAHKECNAWTLRKSDNRCWIKTSDDGRSKDNLFISGTKGCAGYVSLGCWKDTSNRAIATLEESDGRLAGNYKERENAVELCFEVAKSKGYPAFAVQDGGQCFASSTALETYKKYGAASNCANGKGGGWANDVYKIAETRAASTTTTTTTSTPGIPDLNPIVESSEDFFTEDNLYRGSLVLENSCEGNNPSNYWLSPDGKTGEEASIILNLGRVTKFNRFNIKNTHNGESNDRGAKNIGLYTSDSKNGPWKLIAEKLLADAKKKGCDVPVEEVTIGTTYAQFIKLVIYSYYGKGGGLQYLGVELSEYESLGCWKDSSDRTIATLEGTDGRLAGNYWERKNAIQICFDVAKSKEFPAFAVQNGGWCVASSSALETYKKYGAASNCANGKGGIFANDVYKIRVVSCGNHKATSCSKCPQEENGVDHGKAWCNGDCSWNVASKECEKKTCACGIKERDCFIGGVYTKANEFPWMALLLGPNGAFCGGSLINDRWIVTAAHCFPKYDSANSPNKVVKVILGEHDTRKDDTTWRQQFYVDKIIRHPKYSGDKSNDIALWKLSSKVNINKHVPVCLPAPNEDYTGKNAINTGWGVTEDGHTSHILKKLKDLPVVSDADCEAAMQPRKITPDMLCAGGEENKDACQENSGGPLLFKKKSYQYEMIGVVSWGLGCGNKGKYGVYAETSAFVDWIKKTVQDNGGGEYCEH